VTSLGRNYVRALFTMDDWVDGALLQQRLVASVATSAAALAVLFLGESVTGGIALGGALILVGAVAASLARVATVQEQQVP